MVLVVKLVYIGKWSEVNECSVLQIVLPSVEDSDVISGDDVYWCVV